MPQDDRLRPDDPYNLPNWPMDPDKPQMLRVADLHVEGCCRCGALMEVMPGLAVGGFFYHLSEPDLMCDTCVRREHPDLALELARARSGPGWTDERPRAGGPSGGQT